MYHMYSWFGMLEALTWAGRPGSPATLLMTSHRNMKHLTAFKQLYCFNPNAPSPILRLRELGAPPVGCLSLMQALDCLEKGCTECDTNFSDARWAPEGCGGRRMVFFFSFCLMGRMDWPIKKKSGFLIDEQGAGL